MTDKTNYAQSLMHMIKGNLGTGILAMPASFAHTGLLSAIIGLPILCLIATYCVHLLIKSSEHLESKTKGLTLQYASLAKHSFKFGPGWLKPYSGFMCFIVDSTLLIAQIGVCCVYIVFVVDNIAKILASNDKYPSHALIFLAILPVAFLLSYIRTLRRLAIASACANLLQAVGIVIILDFLMRDINKVDLRDRDNFRPLNEAALGFGSAMFAFEGISVVLPIYTRMKHSERMSGFWGVINVSYVVLLILYFSMGLFGYLRFGRDAGDSITLNLPSEPLYDGVRALFTVSVFLTYPLQFYVPNEIIWTWVKSNLIGRAESEFSTARALQVVIPIIKLSQKDDPQNEHSSGEKVAPIEREVASSRLNFYEYCCRTMIVLLTFILAISVPKLNLLMDLIGSISGTALSLILPAIIHLAAFWDDTHGLKKTCMIFVDMAIIIFGVITGLSGSVFSFSSIWDSFRH